MLRVFHVPSHLAYATALIDIAFEPVPPPGGESLTVGRLLALPSWGFFDVLHLHTVEFATAVELDRLFSKANAADVRVILTVHDLQPNIEGDRREYWRKLALAVHRATAVVTLTSAAASELRRNVHVESQRISVISHGPGLPLDVAAAAARTRPDGALAVYGALRPNRDVLATVRAWSLLRREARRPLRVVLRTVGSSDETRYARTLSTLRTATAEQPDLDVQVRCDFVPAKELTDWLAPASALILPYRSVTHSGQLELARDLGMPVLAPDLHTLHAQLGHSGARLPVCWYEPPELEDSQRFAKRLEELACLRPLAESDRQELLGRRHVERARILKRYGALYGGLDRVSPS